MALTTVTLLESNETIHQWFQKEFSSRGNRERKKILGKEKKNQNTQTS